VIELEPGIGGIGLTAGVGPEEHLNGVLCGLTLYQAWADVGQQRAGQTYAGLGVEAMYWTMSAHLGILAVVIGDGEGARILLSAGVAFPLGR
jgi:hypothetical protein